MHEQKSLDNSNVRQIIGRMILTLNGIRKNSNTKVASGVVLNLTANKKVILKTWTA